jgi:hypothetical protein
VLLTIGQPSHCTLNLDSPARGSEHGMSLLEVMLVAAIGEVTAIVQVGGASL